MQLALAVVLSGTALLLALSLRHVVLTDPGFAASHALAARVSAYPARYPDKAAVTRFFRTVVAGVAALPGVTAAAAGSAVPLAAGGLSGTAVAVEGRVVPISERPAARWQIVSPGYFAAVGIPVVAGRDFLPADADRATHQTIINQALARRLFGNADPIGRRVAYGAEERVTDWHEIVGVVADAQYAGLSDPAGPRAYDLLGQHWSSTEYIAVRGRGDPYALVASIRAVVRQIDPEAPMFEVQSLDDAVAGAIFAEATCHRPRRRDCRGSVCCSRRSGCMGCLPAP
jgi:putative ABC transport system permease protein